MKDQMQIETVTMALNGDDAGIVHGTTIWKAAKGRDLIIPYPSHRPKPRYRPGGNCRHYGLSNHAQKNQDAQVSHGPK